MNRTKLGYYIFISVFLTLGLSLSLQSLLAAWTEPTQPPPDDNTYPPIYNVSSNPADYAEIGTTTAISADLSVGGNSYFGGNVGIGTTTPARKLDVFGNIRSFSNGGNQLSLETSVQRWDLDVDTSQGNSLRIRNMTAGTVPFYIDTSGVLHGNGSGLTNLPAAAHSHSLACFTALRVSAASCDAYCINQGYECVSAAEHYMSGNVRSCGDTGADGCACCKVN